MSNLDFSGLKVLVVEDDSTLRKRIAARLESLHAEVLWADTLGAAKSCLAESAFDCVFLDVNLPDGVGTSLLREQAFPSATAVIVITAHGGVPGAVEAMRLGAVDYLVKPFDISELGVAIERAQTSRQAARLGEHRRGEVVAEALFFGSSLAPLEIQLQKILAADQRMETGLAPVLIEGETGTGKTSFARWLHDHGPRAARPLVEVNCSALPETLAESELFGHERGAFTDARTTRLGLFEAASGGTLFLDELPSLSVALQAKVLSAIEDRRIRRVGGTKLIAVDARIIAASNRSLRELVAQGRFREDLFHRLDLFRLNLQPLRERGIDLITLAQSIVERLCRRHRLPAKIITPLGQRRLAAYHWPGNVRELAHEVERAIVFEDGLELNFPQLGPGVEGEPPPEPLPADWFNADYDFTGFTLDRAIDRFIEIALQRTGGNVSAASRLLGVPRDFIRYRLHGPRGPKSKTDLGSNA